MEKNLVKILRSGGIALIPTDTTYGVVGSALRSETVNEIYRLRKRNLAKPFIILIAARKDLKKFGITPTETQKKILEKVWPGPTSVVVKAPEEKFSYLHRGKNTLCFRVPAKKSLRALLRKTGPLVAPSANPEGHKVARTAAEARAYFGEHVALYQNGGVITTAPSKIIDITGGLEKVLR